MIFGRGLGCPYCGSSDVWQPRVHSWLDDALLIVGLEQFDCRKCRRRLFFRVKKRDIRTEKPANDEASTCAK